MSLPDVAMSFQEIADVLNTNKINVFRTYQRAIAKVVRQIETTDKKDIKELLAEIKPEETMYDRMTEQMFIPDDSSNLRGFWREENV